MERKPRKDGTVVKYVDLRVSGTLVRKVPLRLRNLNDRYSSKAAQFEYAIDIDEPAKVRVKHADPSECCKLAVAELEKELAIDWTPVLLVSVTGLEYPYYGHNSEHGNRKSNEAELKIEFLEYEVGKRGQEAVYRSKDRDGYGHVQTGELTERRDNRPGLSSAVVPATDVNRAKLAALVTAVHDLRDRVSDLMKPEVIAKTLTDMRVLALPVKAEVAVLVEPKPGSKPKPKAAKKS